MDIKRYAGLHPFFKTHQHVIEFKLIYRLRKKQHFANYSDLGTNPEEIVIETWIHLMDLSLQLGHTLLMVEQYRWTTRLLESRGMSREVIMGSFVEVILSTKEIILRMIQDERQIAAWTHLFHAIRDEIVTTLKEFEPREKTTGPVKLFGQ